MHLLIPYKFYSKGGGRIYFPKLHSLATSLKVLNNLSPVSGPIPASCFKIFLPLKELVETLTANNSYSLNVPIPLWQRTFVMSLLLTRKKIYRACRKYFYPKNINRVYFNCLQQLASVLYGVVDSPW